MPIEKSQGADRDDPATHTDFLLSLQMRQVGAQLGYHFENLKIINPKRVGWFRGFILRDI